MGMISALSALPSRAPLFRDRRHAGQVLAEHLRGYGDRDDVIVLALPRGGVPVAYEVAAALNLPLDVFVVRKLGVPGYPELAMGAIASGGVQVLNEDVVSQLPNAEQWVAHVANEERRELERREASYRGARPRPDLRGKTVILIDDGLATGATMRAAARALKQQGVARLVVAVPVAAAATCAEFRDEVDDTICVFTPESFAGVGQFYQDFSQTSDNEVRELLAKAASRAKE
jgi:putative phosphoribosyl transferase